MLAITLALAWLTPQTPAPPPAPPQPTLLVVAPAEFLPHLEPLLQHKRATGIPAAAMALTEALAGDGADDAERLKRSLYACKLREPGLAYVLLVGDADRMPVRFLALDRVTEAAFDVAFYPSDLYYADLCTRDGSFETWNATTVGYHRGYFGEVRGEKHKRDPINFDGIDYLPELAVGRWPVATVAEVERLVRKTIAYEQWVLAGNGCTAAIVGVPGWIDARRALQQLADRLSAPWRVQRLWWQDAGAGDPAIGAPSLERALAACNGDLGVLLHAGHGSEQGFDGCLGTAHLGKLANAQPFVAMSIGCTTARLCTLPPYEPYVDADGRAHRGTNGGEVFTAPPPPPAVYQRDACNPTSFGEQLLRATDHGAVAYIGCDTGGQPCALTLLAAFGEALADPTQPTLGAAWRFAVTEYCRRERLAELVPTADWYPPSVFFQAMKYLVLGDPSLRLPGRCAPQRASAR